MTASTGDAALELSVEGMTCVACTRRVQKALERVDGVTKVEVDLVRERAIVHGHGVREGALGTAAEQAGYKLRPLAATDAAPGRPAVPWREPLAALGLAAVASALPFVFAPPLARGGVELVLGAAVVLGLGRHLLRRAWDELRSGGLGMSFLVSSGALGALGLHVAMWADMARGHHVHGSPHSEAASAATIVAFVLLGRVLEARARAQVAHALAGLDARATEPVRVVRHGAEGELPPSELRAGDVVLVAPHALVPADGTVEGAVVGGTVFLDEGHLTGESRPVERGPGAVVHAGTVNTTRPFRLRVTAVGDDTRQAQIQALVRGALQQRSPTVEAAERWSHRVVPAVLAAAALTFVALLVMGAGLAEATTRAVTVLVVACPCALGLATPTAIAAALGSGLRAGILVAKPAAFEALARVHTVVLDKTGTLTEGRPRPTRLVARGVAEDELLRLAATVETESEHPLGRAIFEEAMRRKLRLGVATDVTAIEGGVRGAVEGHAVEATAARADEEDEAMRAARAEGASIVVVRRDGAPLGWLAIVDALRPETPAVIAALGARGLAVWMLSGDHEAAARARGREAGLRPERTIGGLTPEDKRERLRALEQAGPTVMIGDGINDAPALATASVGVAIGRGAKVAVESAGLTLEHGLTRLVPAIDLARRTRSVITQNLVLAFAYNVVAIPLAALGVLDRVAAPWLDGGSLAALAMAASSILVVLSSLRLSAEVTVAR